MRKILLIKDMDPETFNLRVKVLQRNEDGTVETLSSSVMSHTNSKYTKDQLEKIEQCNRALASKGMPELTEEEADYMLDPSGIGARLSALEEEMKDPETIQRLAGFKVEKTVTPLS